MEDNFKEVWNRVINANNANNLNNTYNAEANTCPCNTNMNTGSLYRPSSIQMRPAFDLKATLEDFIEDETSDSAYYNALAVKTVQPNARRIFNMLSAEEKRHSRQLQTVYFLLTGNSYTAKRPTPAPPRSMLEALRQRYAAELQGAKAYADAANQTDKHDLKDLFTSLSADEKRHANDIKRLVESSLG